MEENTASRPLKYPGGNTRIENQQTVLEAVARIAAPLLAKHWLAANEGVEGLETGMPRLRVKAAFGPSGAKVIRGTNKLAKPWEVIHSGQTTAEKIGVDSVTQGFEVYIAPSAGSLDEAARYVIAAMCECRAQATFKLAANKDKGRWELMHGKKKAKAVFKGNRLIYFKDLFGPTGSDAKANAPETWRAKPAVGEIITLVAKELGMYWDHAKVNFLRRPDPTQGEGGEEAEGKPGDTSDKDHRAVTVECSNRDAKVNPCPVNFRSSATAFQAWGQNIDCPFCKAIHRTAKMVIAQRGKGAAKAATRTAKKAKLGNTNVAKGMAKAQAKENGEKEPPNQEPPQDAGPVIKRGVMA